MLTSKLHLVDLAGSERVSRASLVGTMSTVANHINLSLHFLEQVILALQVLPFKQQSEQVLL